MTVRAVEPLALVAIEPTGQQSLERIRRNYGPCWRCARLRVWVPELATQSADSCGCCAHPRGWHFRSSGSCLDCACMAFEPRAFELEPLELC